MSESKPNQFSDTTKAEMRWKDLYRMAGIAALVSEIVILTESIFLLLQNNPFGGLVSLDLFLFVGNLFSILLFLALYVSLKQVNESYVLIALALGLISVVLLIPSRPIIELFSLSGQYATATTEAAKIQYLATGGTLLALFDGTGWFMNTLFGAISLLVSSLLMLRSNIYGKSTAYVGILTNVVVCGFFIPVFGKFLLFLSLPGYMIWYFLLAKRFFQMERDA